MRVMLLACLVALQTASASAQVKSLLNKAANKANNLTRQQTSTPTTSSDASQQAAPNSAIANEMAGDEPAPVPVPKRAGTILFSSDVENLKKDAENESGLSTKFTLGTPIYFRAYYALPLTTAVHKLDPSVSRFINTVHSKFKVKFTMDNTEVFTQKMQEESLQNEWKDTWTSFKGALQAADNEAFLMSDIFQDFVSQEGKKLTNGAHTIKMDLIPCADYPNAVEGAVAATGTFTLVVNANSVDPNNDKLCLPTAKMENKELEASIIKAFKAKGWKEQPQVVRIVSDRWNIERNEATGVILRRTVDAVVGSTLKDKCISQEFSFAQDYDGSSYQKEVYLLGVGGQKDINCKCIGK